jgi:hypothetical protein
MLASFMAAEAAGAMGAIGAAEVAGAAGAMELGSAGAFDMGLGGIGEAMGLGLGEAALGAMAPTTGAGITQAAMGEATQSALAGGAGAGEAGINAQMVNASQNAAASAANSGLPQAAPQYLDPRQAAYLDASTASITSPVTTDGGSVLARGAASTPDVTGAGYSLTGANPSIPNPTYNFGAAPGGEGIKMASSAPGVTDGLGMKSSASALFNNPFVSGMKSVMDWAENNKFQAAGLGYMGAKRLGLLDDNAATAANRTPDKGMGYSMSPDFQGRFANPEDYQYTPKRYNYAEGGIMQAGGVPAYARGGDLSSTLDSYTQMMNQRARPPSGKGAPRGDRGDPGIIFDSDPDTRSLDPVTAAQVRMAKVNKRANMQTPGIKRPTPMGQIDLTPPGTKKEAAGSSLDPENAAQGGIMHSSLGGYAAGGNPRLLKGPGDGMSDNIPATINGRQPARLADGEFVVPADVVSHLGNGSTDAGAKKLHEMMTKLRRERTGNPKQGKKINPNKFVPK